MTATVLKIPDPLVVLRRAEQKHTGEEPGDLDHLAEAVRTQIMAPLTAGDRPVVDDVQVKQLRADKERLEGVVAESRALAVSRGKTVDAQAREIAELKRQLAAADEDTRRRIDAAVAALETPLRAAQDEITRLRKALELRTQELDEVRQQPAPGVDASVLEQAQRDNARLADQLAKAEEQLSLARRDLELANRTLDEIADEEADRPAAAQHRHQYEVDPATGEHHPCGCGQPWIRDLVDDGEPVEPDVEPWAELFGRIRDELGEVAP